MPYIHIVAYSEDHIILKLVVGGGATLVFQSFSNVGRFSIPLEQRKLSILIDSMVIFIESLRIT